MAKEEKKQLNIEGAIEKLKEQLQNYKILTIKAEGALEKLGKEIDNLDEIRTLFLDHPSVDFTPEWRTPNVESTIKYLCNDYSFNKGRVEKALEKYVESKTKARQFTLGDF